MTQNHDWRKGEAWRRRDPASGFAPTLSPDDPRAQVVAAVSGSVVRDNRRQVVLRAPSAAAPMGLELTAAPVDATTPVSGVITRQRPRPEIPVAKITREEPTFLHDTHRDAAPPEAVRASEVVPDYASEYVPPQPLPEVSQHKTFELRPVRLAPEIHPRTAPTVLNLRTQNRHHQKQEKDARELAELVAQADRRRRVPWIALLFLTVAVLGFLVGTVLVGATRAEPVIGPDPATQSVGAHSPGTEPVVATPGAPTQERPGTPGANAGAAKSPEPLLPRAAAAPPQPDTQAAPPRTATSHEKQATIAEPLRNSATAPLASPPESEPRPVREVWLR